MCTWCMQEWVHACVCTCGVCACVYGTWHVRVYISVGVCTCECVWTHTSMYVSIHVHTCACRLGAFSQLIPCPRRPAVGVCGEDVVSVL